MITAPIALLALAAAAAPAKAPPRGARAPHAARAPAAPQREPAEAILERWSADGDTRAAEAAIRSGLAAQPKSGDLHLALATVLAADGRTDDARRELETVLAVAPYTPAALSAQLQLDVLPPSGAALRPDAARALAYGRLLDALRAAARDGALGRVEALEARSAELDPARWEASAIAGLALGEAGRYRACDAALRRALAHAPADAAGDLQAAATRCGDEAGFAAAIERATKARDSGDHRAAADAYREALRLRPARLEHGLDAAAELAAAGESDAALEVARAVEARGPAADRRMAAGLRARLERTLHGLDVAVAPTPAPALSRETPGLLQNALALEQQSDAGVDEAIQAWQDFQERVESKRRDVEQKRERMEWCRQQAEEMDRQAAQLEEQARQAASQAVNGWGVAAAAVGGAGAGWAQAEARQYRDEAAELAREIARLERELAALDAG